MTEPQPVEWRPGDPQILVFAGTYNQAEYWAHHVAKLPNRRAFRYVDSPDDLRGRRGNKAVMVGSFWRRNYSLIHDLLDYSKLMDLDWLPDYDVRVEADEIAETSVQRYIRENQLRPEYPPGEPWFE